MEIISSTAASALHIVKVSKEGGATKEYVMLRASEKCNLNRYAIADNTYDSSGHTSNKHPHLFWFPRLEVEKGEFVFLYSCRGEYRKRQTKGGICHDLYWQLGVGVWNDERDQAVLLTVAPAERKEV